MLAAGRTPNGIRHDSPAAFPGPREDVDTQLLQVRLLLCLPGARIEHRPREYPLAAGILAPAEAPLPTGIHVSGLADHRCAAWRPEARTTLAASILVLQYDPRPAHE